MRIKPVTTVGFFDFFLPKNGAKSDHMRQIEVYKRQRQATHFFVEYGCLSKTPDAVTLAQCAAHRLTQSSPDV